MSGELGSYFKVTENGYVLVKENNVIKPYPYQGIMINGLYLRKDGRKHIVWRQATEPVTKRGSVSYPKFLMECSIGRKLKDGEEVDHIDRDYTNNELSNLTLRKRSEHAYLDTLRVFTADMNCPICDTIFTPTKDQRNMPTRRNAAGPFCSRRCTGLYGRLVQDRKMTRLQRNPVRKSYYRLDKVV